jgi:hypothetical protein
MPTLGPSDIEQIHDYMHDVVADITAHMRAEFPGADNTAKAACFYALAVLSVSALRMIDPEESAMEAINQLIAMTNPPLHCRLTPRDTKHS